MESTVHALMAECAALYFPPPSRHLTPAALRQPTNVNPHPSLIHSLRDFLQDPSADFRTADQAIVVQKLLLRLDPLLVVCSAGIGKTFLVFFVAKMFDADKITVVFLPLLSLQSDFVRRARQHRVCVERWSASPNFNPTGGIVYFSVEHLQNTAALGCALVHLYTCFSMA